jgi:hypothetical protein
VVVQEVDKVSKAISKGPRKKAKTTDNGDGDSLERKGRRRRKVTSLLPVGSPISRPSMIDLVSDNESERATPPASDVSTDKDDIKLRINGDVIREVNLEDEIKQLDEDRTLTNREKLFKWLKLNGYSCVKFQPTTAFDEREDDKGTALITLPQYPEISVSLEK